MGSTSKIQLELRLLQLRTTKIAYFLSYWLFDRDPGSCFLSIIPTQKWVGISSPIYLKLTMLFQTLKMRHSLKNPKKSQPPNLWTLQPASPSAASSSCEETHQTPWEKLGEKFADFLPGSSEQVDLLWDVGDGWFWRFWRFTWKTNGSNMCIVRLKGFNSWRHRNGCMVEWCGNVWKWSKKQISNIWIQILTTVLNIICLGCWKGHLVEWQSAHPR